jgi:hypothetical protein
MDCGGCGGGPRNCECGIGVRSNCDRTSAGAVGAGRERWRDIGWCHIRRGDIRWCYVRRRDKRGASRVSAGGGRSVPGITGWTSGRPASPGVLCKSVRARGNRGGSARLCDRLLQQFQQHDDNDRPLTISDRGYLRPRSERSFRQRLIAPENGLTEQFGGVGEL